MLVMEGIGKENEKSSCIFFTKTHFSQFQLESLNLEIGSKKKQLQQ